MKNKKWLFVIAAAFVVLTVPFSVQRYKDGGTKTFTSLTYKIVDFNKLTENGEIYSETKVYPFPMNFMSDDFLMASANGASVKSEDETDKIARYEKAGSANTGIISSVTDAEEIDFSEEHIQMNVCYDGDKNISIEPETRGITIVTEGGMITGCSVKAFHPLECKESMKTFNAQSDKVKISFPFAPESVSVCCFPDSAWGKTDTPPEEIQVNNGEFSLKKGGYIYMISYTLREGENKTFKGVCSFYAVLN